MIVCDRSGDAAWEDLRPRFRHFSRRAGNLHIDLQMTFSFAFQEDFKKISRRFHPVQSKSSPMGNHSKSDDFLIQNVRPLWVPSDRKPPVCLMRLWRRYSLILQLMICIPKLTILCQQNDDFINSCVRRTRWQTTHWSVLVHTPLHNLNTIFNLPVMSF